MEHRFILGSLSTANIDGFDELDHRFRDLIEQLDREHSIKERKRLIDEYVNRLNPLPRNATPTQSRNVDIMRRLTRNNIHQFMIEAFILCKMRERKDTLKYEKAYAEKQLDITLLMHNTADDEYKRSVKNKIIEWKTKLLDIEEKMNFVTTMDAMYEEEHRQDKDAFVLDFYSERNRPKTLCEYEMRLEYWVGRLCNLNDKYLRIIDTWEL